jgi:DNA-binding NtrC family response regulator
MLAGGTSLQLGRIIGQSPAIRRVARQVEIATGGDVGVLISGPAGSGRESLARAIHQRSGTAAAPIMPLACDVLDSELFDSTIAAFAASCGELKSERAVVLLLEVDQLPRDAQASLAGILNRGELNLRTLATAKTPLIELAQRDAYRPDLAFALSTLSIQIPPLAGRVEDIPLLAQHFLEQQNAAGGKQLAGFSEDALDELAGYPWPNDIHELAELVREACVVAAGPLVQTADLPERIGMTAAVGAQPAPRDPSIALDDYLAEIERELIVRAIHWSKGNKAHAARLLGISRARLLRRVEHFGI